MEKDRPVILLIDDNRDIREGFNMVLEEHGYAVEIASNGKEAMERLREGLRPAVIVLDLMMPVMNGYEFRQEQMQDLDMATIPLIAYSGLTNAQENAAHLKASAYLQRPVDAAALIATLHQLCPS